MTPLKSGKINATTDDIQLNSKFQSFVEFERVFDRWKKKNNYLFRIASSEMLKDKGKREMELYKYRYVVYHCIHYGAPRIRGFGSRLRQNYLPCGCKAAVRLSFIASDKAMVITKFDEEHTGHGSGKDLIDAHNPDTDKAKYIAESAQKIALSRRTLAINGEAEAPSNGKLLIPPYDEHFEAQYKYLSTLRTAQRTKLDRLNMIREKKGLEPFVPPSLDVSTINYFFDLAAYAKRAESKKRVRQQRGSSALSRRPSTPL